MVSLSQRSGLLQHSAHPELSRNPRGSDCLERVLVAWQRGLPDVRHVAGLRFCQTHSSRHALGPPGALEHLFCDFRSMPGATSGLAAVGCQAVTVARRRRPRGKSSRWQYFEGFSGIRRRGARAGGALCG